MQPILEHLDPGGQASFICRRFQLPAFPFTWHVHPELELTLIVRGRGRRFVGDSIEAFAEGDLVLLGPNLPHTWHSRPGRRVESVVIQFRRDCLGDGFFDSPEANRIDRLFSRAARGVRFTGQARLKAAQRMREIDHASGMRRVTLLLDTLESLARCRGGVELSSEAFADDLRVEDRTRIDRVCRFINDHYTEPITQAQAAASIHMSPAAFSRFFKRLTRKTFVDYLHEIRIGRACRALIETDQPITDVCFESGFGNLSNFNRVFKRLKGVSPRAYRGQFAA